MVLALGGLFERLDWLSILWGSLWAGLVAFTLGMSFLLWTRWGDYHLTGKCVMFSLLAHLVIGLFFATAEVVDEVVVAFNHPDESSPITIDRVQLVGSADDVSDSAIDGRSDESSAAGMWDRVTGRAPIESVSLEREGPARLESPPPERTSSGELTALPVPAPQPEIPMAVTKASEPELSRPAREALERAEVPAAPLALVPTTSAAKSDVLPDSVTSRSAPVIGSTALNRLRIAESDSSDSASRAAPRIPAGGVANDREAVSRPVVSPIRAGTTGINLPTTPGGPTSTPEVVSKNNPEPRVGSDPASGDPSSSVRIGIPTGTNTGTAGAVPSRSTTPDTEAVTLPKARIAGAGISSGNRGVTPANVPEATSVRSIGPTGGTAGMDRPGVQLGTPEIYRERMNPNRSEQALKRGGSKASEEAVERALQWLANHQEADGHWDVDGFQAHCPAGHVCSGVGSQNRDDCAVTGLVLLAFLGAGNTHWDGKYSTHVLRGLNWLIEQEKANGDLRGTGRMYSQGIATLAMSEALAMSNDPKLREPVERAARFIVAAQNQSSGGWRYLPGQYGDTSIFGWQLMALKSASLAGIEIPDTTWQKARTWLHLVGSGRHRGLAAYQPTEAATPPMTAEALACRVFLGESTDNPTLREAADYLMQFKPQWSRLNLYYWYYGTLACFQMSGEYWTQWNTSVRDVLISHQVRDGHAAGSWDPNATVDPWGREGGRVYSTALAALCLEVYYRFLPVQSLTSDDAPIQTVAPQGSGRGSSSKAARNP